MKGLSHVAQNRGNKYKNSSFRIHHNLKIILDLRKANLIKRTFLNHKAARVRQLHYCLSDIGLFPLQPQIIWFNNKIEKVFSCYYKIPPSVCAGKGESYQSQFRNGLIRLKKCSPATTKYLYLCGGARKLPKSISQRFNTIEKVFSCYYKIPLSVWGSEEATKVNFATI